MSNIEQSTYTPPISSINSSNCFVTQAFQMNIHTVIPKILRPCDLRPLVHTNFGCRWHYIYGHRASDYQADMRLSINWFMMKCFTCTGCWSMTLFVIYKALWHTHYPGDPLMDMLVNVCAYLHHKICKQIWDYVNVWSGYWGIASAKFHTSMMCQFWNLRVKLIWVSNNNIELQAFL